MRVTAVLCQPAWKSAGDRHAVDMYDFHVRTISRYVADFLAYFVVCSADWSEEMAPKRRISEKKLQAWAANRLKRHAKVCNLYVGVRVSGGELRSFCRFLRTLHATHVFVLHESAIVALNQTRSRVFFDCTGWQYIHCAQ